MIHVAKVDGKVVGVIRWDGTVLHLIYVVEEHRRTGVATRMWNELGMTSVSTRVTKAGFGFFSSVMPEFDNEIDDRPDIIEQMGIDLIDKAS